MIIYDLILSNAFSYFTFMVIGQCCTVTLTVTVMHFFVCQCVMLVVVGRSVIVGHYDILTCAAPFKSLQGIYL